MRSKLSGKVAIVTGASKGIGAEIARQFAAEGASVVVNYASNRDDADKVVSNITSKGAKAIAVQADVSKSSDVKNLFAEASKAFGRFDVLVNNAGIYKFASFDQITPEDFYRHFDLDVMGIILTIQEAAKHFGPEGGSIINLSTVASRAGFPGSGVYAASKAAVNSLTRTFAAELRPRKIRVNAVAPGVIATEGNAEMSDPNNSFYKAYVAGSKLGRIGQVDDIAPTVVYFASDDSKWVTGEVLFVTGGF